MLAVTGLVLAVAGTALGIALRLERDADEVRTTRHAPALHAAQRVAGMIGAVVQNDLGYLATRNGLMKDQYLGRMTETREAIEAIERGAVLSDAAEGVLTERVAAACARFDATATAAFSELEASSAVGPARLADQLQAGEAWLEAANDLSAHERGRVDEATMALAASARATSVAAVAAALLLALMAAGTLSPRLRAALVRSPRLVPTFDPGVEEATTVEKRNRTAGIQLSKNEERLRRAQQLEGLGRLAGGVAHDFNNLLAVISSNAAALANDLSDPDAAAMVSDIVEAADQGGRLTSQLLDVSGANVGAAAVIDLDHVLANTTHMLGRVMGRGIEIVLETSARGLIAADRGQIDQLVLNLVINARDATPGGGTITVRTADVPPNATYPTGAVLLSVRDPGCGMSAETQAHLFEPFYTTKERGKGTGLGLATVYGIVRSGGGSIEVDSVLGRGSEFRVYLPRKGEAARASRPPTRLRVGPAKQTVLLVDDDAAARGATQGVLERAGYTVTAAADGQEALALVQGGRGFDIVLSEVRMPVMGGLELARALNARSPPTRLLLMTGSSEQAAHAEYPVVHKPFRDEDLLGQLVELFHHPPSAGRMHATVASPHVKRGSAGSAVRLRAADSVREAVSLGRDDSGRGRHSPSLGKPQT
jgi:signal transduction histidine kinase/CheY-like chemotaxis protein